MDTIAPPRPSRRILRTVLTALAVAGGVALSAAAQPADGDAPPIRLKSRTFTPPRGVEPALHQKAGGLPAGWLGLVQLEEVPDEAQLARLAEAGVELLEYIPDNAWIARMPAELGAAQRVRSVRWIGRLQPEDKVHPHLAGLLSVPRRGRTRLEVEATAGAFAAAVARIEKLGGRVLEASPELSYLLIELPRASVSSLAADHAILWIGPEPPAKTPLNNLVRINTRAEEAQAAPYSLSGAGVDLGIWDGGPVFAHTDFTGRLTVVEGGTPDGHATHVAGTMAGDGTNSPLVGFPAGHFRGMAPAADIFSWNFNGNTVNEHNAGINTFGIDVSQNSWGFVVNNGNCALFGDYTATSRGYDQVVTGIFGRRIPIAFASGNSRDDGICGMSTVPPFLNYANVTPPGQTSKNVLAIGAINSDDSAMTAFSSWGPVDDGRLKPEIVAPGCSAGGFVGVASTFTNNGYAVTCGTSMATPAVSGNIGLLLERYRAVCPATGGDPLPSTVRALLVHTARDLDDASLFLNRGPDYASGYGALDVKEAIDMLPFHVEDDVAHGQVDTYQITVTQQSDLKVTLAWDDVPAATGAAVTLVNNLDLELVDPNGGIHRPWVLNPVSPSAAATRTVDNRNVIEQVVVDLVGIAEAGVWTIRVIGTNVPTGPQSYSLVTQHLTASSCAGAPAGDAWIMDKDLPLTPVDPGTEPNPDNGPLWISNQIWVRNVADGGTTHQNPELGQTNFVYARIRNNGATTLNTVRAMVYYANASTGLAWPVDWHLLGEATVVNLAPGGSVIIDPLPWDPPAAGHFCLYVRLLTDQDPMTFPEGPGVYTNTKNNNNIAWKNVNVVDLLANLQAQVDFLVRNTREDEAKIQVGFVLRPDRLGATLLDFALIDVVASEELVALLEERGIEFDGAGFERVDDRTLRMVKPKAALEVLPLLGREEFGLTISIQRIVRRANEQVYVMDVDQNFSFGSGEVISASAVDANAGGVRYEVLMPAPSTGTTP